MKRLFTLLFIAMLATSCGEDEEKDDTGGGPSEPEVSQVTDQDVSNCCRCLHNTMVYDGAYCFEGNVSQCITAISNGAAILSYKICWFQLCVGDCWFMEIVE